MLRLRTAQGSVFENSGFHVSVRTSQLKHSWLENQVLNKRTEDILYLWRHIGWDAVEKEFPARIEEARIIAKEIDVAFSPAMLVDQLSPLSELPYEIADSMKQRLHMIYLQRSAVVELKRQLGQVVLDLTLAYERFQTAWVQRVSADAEEEIKMSWCAFYQCSIRLRDGLDKLPRGIELP